MLGATFGRWRKNEKTNPGRRQVNLPPKTIPPKAQDSLPEMQEGAETAFFVTNVRPIDRGWLWATRFFIFLKIFFGRNATKTRRGAARPPARPPARPYRPRALQSSKGWRNGLGLLGVGLVCADVPRLKLTTQADAHHQNAVAPPFCK